MVRDHISIRVEVADAISRQTDLLVLKHAQRLYGVDLAVARALNLNEGSLPANGEYAVFEGFPPVGAKRVLFLGVPGLFDFGYSQIRQFAYRALSTLAEIRPSVREICLTVHGPGYGLDEIEAFESEIAGVLDALRDGRCPEDLESIVFIEVDRGRASRMHGALDSLVPGHEVDGVGRREALLQNSSVDERLRSIGYDSGAKEHAFVSMPFSDAFDDVFYYGVAPPVRDAGFLCERLDKSAFTGDIVARMKDRISNARFLIADLTGANPNVYLEVGFAWGRNVPTVLLCSHAAELMFDVQGHKCLVYTTIRDLEKRLSDEIRLLVAKLERH